MGDVLKRIAKYEGATTKDGRGPCIWDTFIKKSSGSVADHSNASITTDQYHRYKEDVRILKDIGFDIYRFSISWSRVLPKGGRRGGVNKKGINHYNKLINHILSKGIKPIVTLFHWDLPQVIEDQYQGFLNPKIIDDFRDYVELCFNTFGDRVKLWVTINEPMMYAQQGYASATFAPGRCSNRSRCSTGDSSVEPYIVAHDLLLAHAAAVKLYKEKYQISQKGQIEISLNTNWMVPYSNSQKDQLATDRGFAFTYGWFMEPLYSGSYPLEIIVNVGKRLPNFTKEETNTIKGSYDFIGINYYTARYIADTPCRTQNLNYITDSCIDIKSERNGIPIGPHIEGTWMYIYPEGLQYYLLYIRNKYNDPVIYITENGVAEHKDNTSSILEDDKVRIEYFHSHLSRTLEAISDDFRDYAELCFNTFGDRVKLWVTINEPMMYAQQLLQVDVQIVQDALQISQKGQIGISLNTNWMVPYSNSQKDQLATDRGFAFTYGWFMEPLYSGSYPLEMIVNLGKRLPNFTKEESNTFKGSKKELLSSDFMEKVKEENQEDWVWRRHVQKKRDVMNNILKD
ncbi:cyanogenic beta-glucosidase-like [Euphorbia lathyris]|uniref:cyanogenic beta-glucosidase-like n=1 Tax=Euphorbia lathyris TaxID=212925 RepID=UPI003313F770